MPRVYIIGPMRGIPDLNFPAFDRAAKLGRALGWDVISPAEMDREAGVNEKEIPENVGSPAMSRVFARRDTNAILSLNAEEGDAVALLPGWTNSTGGKAELALAKWTQLKVLSAMTFLPHPVLINGQELVEYPSNPSLLLTA